MISTVIPALVAAVGAFVGIANPVWHFPGAVALFPLGMAWIGIETPTAKSALKRGWMAGSLAALCCMYWVALPLHDYGGLPWVLSLPAPVLMAMGLGIYPALFALAARESVRHLPPLAAMAFLGLCWTVLEMAQDVLFSGFPWLELAAGLAPWPRAIQLASLLGGHAVSGLVAAVGIGLLLAAHPAGGRSRRTALAALLLVVFVAGYGHLTVNTPVTGGAKERVAAIQGNIDQSRKWDNAYRQATVDKYLALSHQEIEANRTALVVWPETALPFYLQDPTMHGADVKVFAKRNRVWLLTGAPAYTMHAPTASYKYYNRAFLIGPDGQLAGTYDKQHLVPFGEYVPFESVFGALGIERLVQAAGDFLPGEGSTPLKAGNLALGMLICYEGIFTELAQNRVESGANVLATISNDAWFGRSSAPLQHLNLTIVRAVEQGRYLIRATNTGVSAFVDPLGRVLARSGLFTACGLSARVRPIDRKTIYHQEYSRIHAGIWIAFALLAAVTALRRFKRGDTKSPAGRW